MELNVRNERKVSDRSNGKRYQKLGKIQAQEASLFHRAITY